MNKKALIIFAKQPLPGTVKTRLTPALSPENAAKLYLHMLNDIMNKTEVLGGVARLLYYEGEREAEEYFAGLFPSLPLFQQTGKDLGARMEAAFGRVFAMGYGAAAIIGTDSPDLPAGYIEEAFRLLENDVTDVIFGPAEDGGYYLLAMKRLQGELFHGISWSTGKVLDESLEKAEGAGLAVATLPPWYDVDTVEDLQRPCLRDEGNCAPLTRKFIKELADLQGQSMNCPHKII